MNMAGAYPGAMIVPTMIPVSMAGLLLPVRGGQNAGLSQRAARASQEAWTCTAS
jgi:hypothetical protein